MKVRELIEKLSQCDPEAEVIASVGEACVIQQVEPATDGFHQVWLT